MSLKRSDNYWKSRWLSESVALTASVVSQPSICRLAGLEGKAEQWGGGFTIAIIAMNNLSCWLHRLYQILFQGLHTSAQPPFQLYLHFSPTPPSHTSSSAWTLLAMASCCLCPLLLSSCHSLKRFSKKMCYKLIVLEVWNIMSIETAAVLGASFSVIRHALGVAQHGKIC